jgi:hypothetical protein
MEDVPWESARLYATLQQSVDEQMRQTGFVPPDGYGMNGAAIYGGIYASIAQTQAADALAVGVTNGYEGSCHVAL